MFGPRFCHCIDHSTGPQAILGRQRSCLYTELFKSVGKWQGKVDVPHRIVVVAPIEQVQLNPFAWLPPATENMPDPSVPPMPLACDKVRVSGGSYCGSTGEREDLRCGPAVKWKVGDALWYQVLLRWSCL